MEKTEDKHLVVFGGGIAGAKLAKDLSARLRVTLVDPNDYFEVPMAAPRNLVKPGFADQSIIPFAKALPDVTFVRGKLVEMGPREGLVETADGKQIRLGGDVNVLATGSFFSNPLIRSNGATEAERKALYARYQGSIAGARRILIAGGGPIGVEIAGELSENFPDKSVTIVESGPRLLAGTSKEAADFAASVLTRRGVTIITGERLQTTPSSPEEIFAEGGEAITDKGRVIPHDLVIWCIGGRPNTDYMKAQMGHVLNAQGRIRVTPDLRVEGCDTLFALGDITDLDENKMAWHVNSQINHAATNILHVLAGRREPDNLVAHAAQTGNPLMVVTLGSRQGVAHLPFLGVVRWPWLTRKAKAADMLVPRYRKLLGL